MIVFLTCKTEFRMQSHPDRRSFLGHSFWKVCSLLKLQINTSLMSEELQRMAHPPLFYLTASPHLVQPARLNYMWKQVD